MVAVAVAVLQVGQGASGGRILVSLLHEMKRSNIERGVAAPCVVGG